MTGASLLAGWRAACAAVLLLMASLAAQAGVLTQESLEARIKAPLHVLPKLPDLPAWPLKHEFDTEPDAGPFGYVFESVDLAPIPGFDGTPLNLLVAIDRKGTFIGVEVISQHEPMFRGGIGEEPLHQFLKQYAGLNLTQQIIVATNGNRTGPKQEHAGQVELDGVAKATASIRIVNQSVLTAALDVARAKLGFAGGTKKIPPAKARDVFEKLGFAQLVERGMVGRVRLTNAEVEALFAGSDLAGADAAALAKPGENFVDLYVAYLNTPTVGRAILGDARFETLMKRNYANKHLWWVGAAGRYALYDDKFVPASVPPRLNLRQNGLPFELRDIDYRDREYNPERIEGAPAFTSSMVLTSLSDGGIDPGRPFELVLNIVRERDSVMRETLQKSAELKVEPARALFDYPPEPLPEWLESWLQRLPQLLVLAAGLVVLSVLLVKQRWTAISARRLAWIRRAFLLYTLVFIGWYAQGQLSIVQVSGAIRSVQNGQGLSSFLYDPITLLLISFTLVSFFVWGRGTFCGWLCPFGALQEFAGLLGRAMPLRRKLIPVRVARRLAWLRYVVLAAIVIAAFVAPRTADTLAEFEPFKTAITTGFDRQWPYVAYAVALLALGAAYYKFFCRFLCPLGAVMSLGGKLRLPKWLARRAECGKPCQTCRSRCAYDAIEPDGAIRYDDCFQCLDCVGIYHDVERCAPLILYARKGKKVVGRVVVSSNDDRAHAADKKTCCN